MKKFYSKDVEHIWEYYKLHILAVIGGIILTVMVIHSVVEKPDVIWNAFYINNLMTDAESQMLMKDFQKNFLGDENHYYSFDTNLTFSINQPAYGDHEQMAKFTMLIAAKEIDFLVADDITIEHYVSLGGFHDLNVFLSNEEKQKWDENLVYLEGADGIERIYGLNITDIITSFQSEFTENEFIASIPINSENEEITRQFIDYLYLNK
ncbi:hypothetical protein KQI76_02030 [Amphibacillus sp. MSJ-3]|uniref:hypothetical protein n=1 Tax=Amphibacillus sp. MSJ-3 TaxID=2841505 RepID=UPI001C0EDA48|nr:hypothetical protein [Amphibacillus sp. MSJ-3]MBU5593930.1 hypothetical protein [Amphibacillus sp. MSJ-3]